MIWNPKSYFMYLFKRLLNGISWMRLHIKRPEENTDDCSKYKIPRLNTSTYGLRLASLLHSVVLNSDRISWCINMNAFTVELIPQSLARKLSTVIKGKEVRNSESTTSLLSNNINNEIIMDEFKCSFLSIGYLLRIKKCILKTFFLKLIRWVAHLRV